MSTKSTSKNRSAASSKKFTPRKNLLLALTLVPFIIGFLLIGAWVLDIEIFDAPQLHVTVGILFFLLSFAISNLLQKRWMLAIGWGLLMVADLIVLAWLHVLAQVFALVLGLIGVVFLGIEFYRQYQANKLEQAKKR